MFGRCWWVTAVTSAIMVVPARVASQELLPFSLGAATIRAASHVASRVSPDSGRLLLGDPEICTDDLRISEMGPDGDPLLNGNNASIAYNPTSNEYLVVWSGDPVIDMLRQIYGQRLDAATGAEVGADDFLIGDLGETALSPGVAYNSVQHEYLVVWYGGTVAFEIYGQRLDGTTGAEVGSDDFQISDGAFSANLGHVVHNPTNDEYLVVWHRFGNENGDVEIYGQRLDGDTGSLIGDEFRISDMGAEGKPAFYAISPRAAYSAPSNEYLVVWCGDDDAAGLVDNEFEIFGQRLDATSGAEVGVNDFRISDMGGTGDPDYDAAYDPGASVGCGAAVAFNATDDEYLVAWMGDDNEGGLVDDELEIFAQRLDAASGAEIGVNDFRVSDMGGTGDSNFDAWVAAVAYNPVDLEYFVVWHGDDGLGGLVDEENEVFGQRLEAATGAEIGANDFRISDMGGTGDPDFDGLGPQVAYDNADQRYEVVWWGDDNVGGLVDNDYEVFGQPANLIFCDGFETGNTSAWSTTVQ